MTSWTLVNPKGSEPGGLLGSKVQGRFGNRGRLQAAASCMSTVRLGRSGPPGPLGLPRTHGNQSRLTRTFIPNRGRRRCLYIVFACQRQCTWCACSGAWLLPCVHKTYVYVVMYQFAEWLCKLKYTASLYAQVHKSAHVCVHVCVYIYIYIHIHIYRKTYTNTSFLGHMLTDT